MHLTPFYASRAALYAFPSRKTPILARRREQLYAIQALTILRILRNLRGVYVSSAVAQLRDVKTSAVNSFGKFICVMTGYAGGESTSQIEINRPLPE
jgi:hypothetical protein